MTNEEAIKYLIAPIATSTEPSEEYLKQKEAYELAIKCMHDRPQGKWIITWHKDPLGRWSNWYEYKCSVCKESVCEMHSDAHGEYATKFCPNCGAKMQKGDSE